MWEKTESQDGDEEKIDRRIRTGDVLGLKAAADSKNPEDSHSLDVAVTLDSYNKTYHDKDDDTEAKEVGDKAIARAWLSTPSKNKGSVTSQ